MQRSTTGGVANRVNIHLIPTSMCGIVVVVGGGGGLLAFWCCKLVCGYVFFTIVCVCVCSRAPACLCAGVCVGGCAGC